MPSTPGGNGLRRPGYAPANPEVGRRGLHTRGRILQSSSDLFAARGFHGTTVEDIAQSVGGSRALVYQYFPSKDAIFVELARECERTVMEHGLQLTGLGPHAPGLRRLRAWLHEWENLYDRYATVFLEFPGIGPVVGRPRNDADVLSARYTRLIGKCLRQVSISGISPDDAAAAALRLMHMTNLYRYRNLFDLPAGEIFSDSLTVAIQLLLFPDTSPTVIAEVIPEHAKAVTRPSYEDSRPGHCLVESNPSLTKREILRVSAMLFTAQGYYSVSMLDIRAAADISRATLYRYFSTKMDILADLTTMAVGDGQKLAGELAEIALTQTDLAQLRSWIRRYVGFHRSYGGVIRAWYDGTLREKLADRIAHGVMPFREAAYDVVESLGIPEQMDAAVATTILLAILGRTSDIAVSSASSGTDDETADFMMTILRRSLAIGTRQGLSDQPRRRA